MRREAHMTRRAFVAAGAMALTSCSQANDGPDADDGRLIEVEAETAPADGADEGNGPKTATTGGIRILVAFFSRADENYANGGKEWLEVGHTKVMAGYLADALGADTYEIVPAEPYPSGYDDCCDVALEEQHIDARPAIAGELPDVSAYDAVLIGCPIWWGGEPMIVRTFVEGVDLSGKTIVPFTTHGGSGLGDVPSNLQASIPGAQLLDGHAGGRHGHRQRTRRGGRLGAGPACEPIGTDRKPRQICNPFAWGVTYVTLYADSPIELRLDGLDTKPVDKQIRLDKSEAKGEGHDPGLQRENAGGGPAGDCCHGAGHRASRGGGSEAKHLFRLMCFNVFAYNQDDYSNNFSWLYDDGEWRLSPAYDLTHSSGFGNQHSTSVFGKDNPTLADVLDLARGVGLPQSWARQTASGIQAISGCAPRPARRSS